MTPEHARAVSAADQENAARRDERAAATDGMTTSERAMTARTDTNTGADDMATKKTTTKKTRTTKGRKAKSTDQLRKDAIASIDENLDEAKPKRPRKTGGKATGKPKAKGKLSGLDAAAQILGNAKEPMGCKAIVELAIEQKLWVPGGRTPHATLYTAVTMLPKAA